MNLEEFYRQAHYLRDFTPTASSVWTISNFVGTGRYLVLGRAVMGFVACTFDLSGGPSTSVSITMPVTIKIPVGLDTVAFCGAVDTGVGVGSAVALSSTSISLFRYDAANWTAGASRGINGWFFYENGEPVV